MEERTLKKILVQHNCNLLSVIFVFFFNRFVWENDIRDFFILYFEKKNVSQEEGQAGGKEKFVLFRLFKKCYIQHLLCLLSVE